MSQHTSQALRNVAIALIHDAKTPSHNSFQHTHEQVWKQTSTQDDSANTLCMKTKTRKKKVCRHSTVGTYGLL